MRKSKTGNFPAQISNLNKKGAIGTTKVGKWRIDNILSRVNVCGPFLLYHMVKLYGTFHLVEVIKVDQIQL